jgi:shikimate dehydrogenase
MTLRPSRYAVVGNPVAHSRSPAIHAAFADQTNQVLTYERVLIGLDAFEQDLETLPAQGFAGINVTVPFKTQAYAYFAERGWMLTARAHAARAANTLSFDSGGWRADNTDGLGLVADLRHRQSVRLTGSKVLVLGAGGAAQGVIGALLEAGVHCVTVANRTAAKAHALAKQFPISALDWQSLDESLDCDLIINATSAGLGETGGLALPSGFMATMGRAKTCYDMVYGPKPSAWLQQARAAGCVQCIDGLGMLVEQAAYAFAFWRGVLPHTEAVFHAIRRELDHR